MCCLRWSGLQKYLPQRVQVKVYLDPRRPHSYLECRVRDDFVLYPRPHSRHRYRGSPPTGTDAVAGLTASTQVGFLFTSYGFLLNAPTNPSALARLTFLIITSAKATKHTLGRDTPRPYYIFALSLSLTRCEVILSRRRREISSNQACGQY